MNTEELVGLINTQHVAVLKKFEASTAASTALSSDLTEVKGRLVGLEQAFAGRQSHGGGGLLSGGRTQTWGAQVAASDALKQFTGQMNGRGTVKVNIRAGISTVSGLDTLTAPQRLPDIVGLPQQKMTVRNLLSPGRTTSNMITYIRQVARDNAAAPVGEDQQKQESEYTFEVAEAPVRTIAHWVPASRQSLDDVPQLESLVDSELRYGLALIEEQQLLSGDGTGSGEGGNLLGLTAAATPYNPPFVADSQQRFDVILQALAQAEQSNIPADGVVLNLTDWRAMQGIKDELNKRYFGNGPFGASINLLWQVPVVATPSMAEGDFLVGGFKAAAQIFDRLDVEVLISSEDRDNFIKNMLTIRAEERLALAVRRPQALVSGSFPTGV